MCKMRDFFFQELSKKLAVKNKIMIITADLGFGLFDDIEKKYPNNFLNVGVAEQNMINIASGLALEGYKVFTYSIGNFSFMRNLEQIRINPAYHNLDVNILCNGGGFAYGPLGFTHHTNEDISIMRSIPNIACFTPTTKSDLLMILNESLTKKTPSYTRFQKLKDYSFNDNDSKTYRPNLRIKGSNSAIISYGSITSIIEKAIRKKTLIAPSLYTINQIDPLLDNEWISLLKSYKRLVIIEEHVQNGSLSEAISAMCFRLKLFPEIRAINIGNKFEKVVGSQDYLCSLNNLSIDNINKILNQ